VDTPGRVCVPSAPRLYVPSPLEAEWLRHAEWMETDKAPEPFGFMGRVKTCSDLIWFVPSGKHTKNYRKSPF